MGDNFGRSGPSPSQTGYEMYRNLLGPRFGATPFASGERHRHEGVQQDDRTGLFGTYRKQDVEIETGRHGGKTEKSTRPMS